VAVQEDCGLFDKTIRGSFDTRQRVFRYNDSIGRLPKLFIVLVSITYMSSETAALQFVPARLEGGERTR
jgi:hypothetical protein